MISEYKQWEQWKPQSANGQKHKSRLHDCDCRDSIWANRHPGRMNRRLRFAVEYLSTHTGANWRAGRGGRPLFPPLAQRQTLHHLLLSAAKGPARPGRYILSRQSFASQFLCQGNFAISPWVTPRISERLRGGWAARSWTGAGRDGLGRIWKWGWTGRPHHPQPPRATSRTSSHMPPNHRQNQKPFFLFRVRIIQYFLTSHIMHWSIRTLMLIQGRLERTDLMQFKREMTWTQGNQPNEMGLHVNSHFLFVWGICRLYASVNHHKATLSGEWAHFIRGGFNARMNRYLQGFAGRISTHLSTSTPG